jgi:hypothetical protein
MRRLLLAGATIVLAFLATPAPARAQVSLGARLGYGFGFGKVGGTLGMDDWLKDQIPIQVDALFRVNPRLALGAYFSHGFARPFGELRDICDLPDADCGGRVQRLGLQAQLRIAERGRYEPWAGAGIGYEWNRLDAPDVGGRVEVTYKGWEFLHLQGGVDYRVAPRLLVGPFLLFSLTQYGEGEVSGDFGRGDGPIDRTTMHEWLMLGIRGRFDL